MMLFAGVALGCMLGGVLGSVLGSVLGCVLVGEILCLRHIG
jgi:hypothetical protein